MTIFRIGKLGSRWHLQHHGKTIYSHPSRWVVEEKVLNARQDCLTPTMITVQKANGEPSHGFMLDGNGKITKVKPPYFIPRPSSPNSQ